MKIFVTILVLASSSAACDKPTDTTETTSSTVQAPDNTRTNARDRAPSALTPMDQGNDQADLDTTQAIRKAIMADGSLSLDAKNVKIITGHGAITLRGPVQSLAEKRTIEAKALAAAGSNRVEDELDVASKQ